MNVLPLGISCRTSPQCCVSWGASISTLVPRGRTSRTRSRSRGQGREIGLSEEVANAVLDGHDGLNARLV